METTLPLDLQQIEDTVLEVFSEARTNEILIKIDGGKKSADDLRWTRD